MTGLQNKLVLNPENSSPQSVAAALKIYLGAAEWELLSAVAKIAADEGKALYLVGGRVRDFLLDRKGKFPDLTYEGDAIELAKFVCKKMGGSLLTHNNFRTAQWDLGRDKKEIAKLLNVKADELPEALDFASARSESYAHPGALPTVDLYADIGGDSERRDFSINAMALRLDGAHLGELTALDGAFNDLEEGILRVLHDQSFKEDATRILRILRFKGRLRFRIEKNTAKSLKQNLRFLDELSGERLRHELDLALAEENWASILDDIQAFGVLKAIHSKLEIPVEAKRAIEFGNDFENGSEWGLARYPKEWLRITIWLMHMTGIAAKEIAKRLNLEADIRNALQQISSIDKTALFPEGSHSEISYTLDTLSPLARFALYASSPGGDVREKIELYVKEWQYVHPKSNGETLKKLGVREGPLYAEILARLRAAWLDDEVNSEEEEAKLLKELLKGEKADL